MDKIRRGGVFLKRAKVFFTSENLKGIMKPTKKKVIILVAAIVAVVIVVALLPDGKNNMGDFARADDLVTRGNIEVTISGSAAVQPYERFEIIPKVSGDIIYCPYEVGDVVQKDDVLYMFDSSDTDLTVERQKISMQQSENNYREAMKESEKLNLVAKNDGIISGLVVKVGEEINSGTKIATIDNTGVLEVNLPFTQAQINSINVGDSATVTSSKHMSSVGGRVIHKATSPYAGKDGTLLYDVTIEFENPGAFLDGMEVGGSVGGNISPGGGTVTNTASSTVVTKTDGMVSKIYYSNGEFVKKGTVIATLSSETVDKKIEDSTLSYKSANLSMRQTEKDLENYNITSPINGTVITKKSKAGDTIDKSNSATTMMVVADISRLKFELAIDELDISKVREGLEVSITCDALPSERFRGTITNVSVEGIAQNGVTTYTAEVEIPEPGNLRPSMNIDAQIIIESASNVLMVPTEDVKNVMGRSFVFVKGDGKDTDDEKDFKQNANKGEKSGDYQKGKMPAGEPPKGVTHGEKPNMPEGMYGGGKGGKAPDFDKMIPEAPDGYKTVEVKTGISNEDYTEIISGLTEGQQIYKQSASSSGSRNMMMGGGMSGRMPGGMGSMPSGGMGGMSGGMRSMPSGGMGGMR